MSKSRNANRGFSVLFSFQFDNTSIVWNFWKESSTYRQEIVGLETVVFGTRTGRIPPRRVLLFPFAYHLRDGEGHRSWGSSQRSSFTAILDPRTWSVKPCRILKHWRCSADMEVHLKKVSHWSHGRICRVCTIRLILRGVNVLTNVTVPPHSLFQIHQSNIFTCKRLSRIPNRPGSERRRHDPWPFLSEWIDRWCQFVSNEVEQVTANDIECASSDEREYVEALLSSDGLDLGQLLHQDLALFVENVDKVLEDFEVESRRQHFPPGVPFGSCQHQCERLRFGISSLWGREGMLELILTGAR